jgi:pyruvate dehydrogenase E2 component (dihydrolipoamide acetyltransferase)
MPTDFKLPDLGENISSGDIVSVLVNEGDDIKVDQGVIEIETGKATVEVPSSMAGKVTKVYVKAGQTIPIGEPLIAVEAAAGVEAKATSKPAAPQAAAPAKPAPQAAPKPAPAPAPKAPPVQQAPVAEAAPPPMAHSGSNGGSPASSDEEDEGTGVASPAGPSTRRLARELGVDLHRVAGTGPGGRITRDDIVSSVRQTTSAAKAPAHAEPGHSQAAVAKKSAATPDGVDGADNFGPIRQQPLSRIRKTIAANMARSTAIPHVTNFDDADITELEQIRKASAADYSGSEIKLTMMAFLMKAVAQSLKLHPLINASLDLEQDQIIYKNYVNLGVAVDTDRGLVVPVLRNVDRLSIPAIAQALGQMAEKARGNKFGIEDTRGGTFTISNLGAIGGTYSTPIINSPEVAILLAGRSRQLPTVVNGKIEPRLMMPLSLSYDHRLVDGAVAARFLNEVKNYLQVPGRLLLAS